MHNHGILRDIFFGSRQLRAKYCQTLGNKPNPSIAIFFDRFTFKFLKNHRLLSKINTVSLRFISLSFPSKKSSSERACPYWQWIVCTVKKRNDWYQWFVEKPFTPCASRTIIFQRENLKYLIVCFTQCTLCVRACVRYLWDVCNEENAGSWHIAQ